MDRPGDLHEIRRAFGITPIVALLGLRQCGKTTLARAYVGESAKGLPPSNDFDLEDPTDLARLADAKLGLSDLEGLVVIDEIQLRPEFTSPTRSRILGWALR